VKCIACRDNTGYKERREEKQRGIAQWEKEQSIEVEQSNRSWRRQRRHGDITNHIRDKESK
jgi:hypothetical protein